MPAALDPEARTALHESVLANMRGEGDLVERSIPSRIDEPAFRAWLDRAGRVGASPSVVARIVETGTWFADGSVDYGAIRVPTLVLWRPDKALQVPTGAPDVARIVPDATLVDLPGDDFLAIGGEVDALLAEIAAFVTGERRLPPPERLLAAILFTDLVGSTERAAAVGDARWKLLLDRHDAAVRRSVGRHGGTVVKSTGDGVLATFPSATAGLRAADDVRAALARDDLQVRVGLHVGEIERRGDDVSGLGVHVAARVMHAAGPGEILVSAAVPLAAAGGEHRFTDRGERTLKGVPGAWRLFSAG
jgi:class 3 adenylate cyclase